MTASWMTAQISGAIPDSHYSHRVSIEAPATDNSVASGTAGHKRVDTFGPRHGDHRAGRFLQVSLSNVPRDRHPHSPDRE
jgi:hypothetical protein